MQGTSSISFRQLQIAPCPHGIALQCHQAQGMSLGVVALKAQMQAASNKQVTAWQAIRSICLVIQEMQICLIAH